MEIVLTITNKYVFFKFRFDILLRLHKNTQISGLHFAFHGVRATKVIFKKNKNALKDKLVHNYSL